MSARLELRARRCRPLITIAWMVLPALSACTTGAGAHRENATAPSAAPTPAPTPAPAATAEAPAGALSPEGSPGAPSPGAPSPGAPSPGPPSAGPSSPPPAVNGPDQTGAEKMLPPCVPVPPPKHVAKRHKTKQTPPQEVPAPPAEPTETPAGAVVDARVGALDTPVIPILGKEVKSPKGEDLGRVVDVLADAEGHVRVAIIDFGGFLGVGTRRIAVDWPLLHVNPNGDKSLILSVTRQKLQSAPEYKETISPQVLMPPAAPDATDPGQTKH